MPGDAPAYGGALLGCARGAFCGSRAGPDAGGPGGPPGMYGVGVSGRGDTSPGTVTGTIGGAGACGYPASSVIFCVGASRADAKTFAPQPPQNREPGAFSVPQLGQRIPRPA
jgi:hypothetical protein